METDEPEVPVLTEVVDEAQAGLSPAPDAAAGEALAHDLEQALLSRFAPALDRLIEERLVNTLSEVFAQALTGVRAELNASVAQMVRDAVASVANTPAAPPKRD